MLQISAKRLEPSDNSHQRFTWNGIIRHDLHFQVTVCLKWGNWMWYSWVILVLTEVSNKPHGISLTGISDTVFSIRAYFFQFTPKKNKSYHLQLCSCISPSSSCMDLHWQWVLSRLCVLSCTTTVLAVYIVQLSNSTSRVLGISSILVLLKVWTWSSVRWSKELLKHQKGSSSVLRR